MRRAILTGLVCLPAGVRICFAEASGSDHVRVVDVAADTGQADSDPAAGAGKQSDLNTITIGEERYEIPDAVIFGG